MTGSELTRVFVKVASGGEANLRREAGLSDSVDVEHVFGNVHRTYEITAVFDDGQFASLCLALLKAPSVLSFEVRVRAYGYTQGGG